MTIDERIANLEKELAELKEERKKEKAVTRFEPKQNEDYLFVDRTGEIKTYYFDKVIPNDKKRKEYNNVFRTSSEENLKKYAHDVLRVQNRLMQLHEELCPDFLSWDKVYPPKYIVVLNLEKRKWYFDAFSRMSPCIVVFTMEAAEKACEILNAEKFMMGGTGDEAD